MYYKSLGLRLKRERCFHTLKNESVCQMHKRNALMVLGCDCMTQPCRTECVNTAVQNPTFMHWKADETHSTIPFYSMKCGVGGTWTGQGIPQAAGEPKLQSGLTSEKRLWAFIKIPLDCSFTIHLFRVFKFVNRSPFK